MSALAAVLVAPTALADGGTGGAVLGLGGVGGVDGPLAGATGGDGGAGPSSGGQGGSGGGGGVDLTTGNGAPGGAQGTSNIIPAKGLAGATGATGQIVSLATGISTIVTGGTGGPGAALVEGVSTWGGGGGGGAGVRATADVTITGTGIVTGGAGGARFNGAGGGGGVGVFSSANVTVDAGGVVTGGIGGGSSRSGGGGGGGAAAIVLTNGGTVLNGGTLTGGAGGFSVADRTVFGGGGDGGAAVQLLSGGTVINAAGGTITGGAGGAGRVDSSDGLFPGDGGAGIKGANISVVNGGTIAGGAGGVRAAGDPVWTPVPGQAIQFTGGVNSLEIWSTSNIIGNVAAFSAADTLKLGGETDATFDLSQIGPGAKYDGFGFYEKVGTGTWALTGAPVTAVPLWTIRDGTLRVDIVTDSDMDVIGGRLTGIGTVGDTTNFAGGTIAPGNGGIGMLTIAGNYTGNGGTVEIEAQLGDDGSPADLLRVEGDTSGTTLLRVINIGGTGAPTVEGIKVIDVGGASAGMFALQGDYVLQGEQAVIAGAYGYTLHQNGVSTPADGDWYLRSALVNPPPEEPAGPLYQPGVALYESYPQILLQLMRMPTLRHRVGEHDVGGRNVADARSGTGSSWWGRFEASHIDIEPGSSTAGAVFDTDQARFQAGFDAQLLQNTDGRLTGGITLQYGTASARVKSFWGDGDIDTDGYGFGGTLTWYGFGGFYADVQAQVTWFDTDIQSDLAGTMAEGDDAFGYGGSLEIGRRLEIGGPWAVTPQAQLAYTTVNIDFSDDFGAEISSEDDDSLLGRLGFALDYRSDWEGDSGPAWSTLYGIANLYHEFSGGTSVDVSGVRFNSEPETLWGGLGLGGTYSWGADKYALYGEASVNTSLDSFGDSYSVNGTGGFRVSW